MAKLAKYELLAKIATGGMAEIHVARARDAGRDRVCVVKKLLPQHASNEDFIQMFLDEGRIAAMFDHPNVVRTHDFGSEDGSHYLAMEYLHGEDLRSVLRTLRAAGRTIPLPIALAVVSAVCAGLHHAHEMRAPTGDPLEIVHRDVSPHNVFLTFEGAVKVVDFGIAKSVDRDWETKHGTLKGKVPYMAPEQIKGRRLDRRADVYAVGVLLYELVLGRRPYVLATGGDFAMMMAITRHDVRAPSAVDPGIAPELERIILGAIAYDPKTRYASAKALRTDLDAFVRSAALDTSPEALASFLAGLFEARFDDWRAAQRAERDLAAHAVEVEEARAQSGVREDDAADGTEVDEIDGSSTSAKPPSVLPAGSAASLVASTSAAVAGVLELFGVTVVTFQGRIDESFDGKALGGSLSGTLLFDMAAVERITSFGVREWLAMMAALDATEDTDAYLARCSEAVVTQLSLIRTFAGRAKVVSFDVPFLCDDCGNAFVRTLDCAHDGAVIAGTEPLTSVCARCGGAAKLDDDPAYLAFAAPFAGRPVPERLRLVLQRLVETAQSSLDAVDKVITASETRVRIHRDLDPAFRWNRVLDGIEGQVVVDFRGAPRFGREAAARFARAIGALGSEVTGCGIVECPVEVAVALGSSATHGRVRFGSLAFEGRCVACGAARTGTVGLRALDEAYRARAAPFVPCRRCNGPLTLGDTAPVMHALFAGAPQLGSQASSATEASDAAREPVASAASHVVPSPRPRRHQLRAWIAVGCVAFMALATAGEVLGRRTNRPSATPPGAVVVPPTANSATPPEVAEPNNMAERRADGTFATIRARATDEDRALVEARAEALARMLDLLERDLDPAVRAANEATAARTAAADAAGRFGDQVGAFASPDRIDVRRRVDDGAAVFTVTYRIGAPAWERAVAYYSDKRSVAGITFAVAFPTRGKGLVVVASGAPASGGLPVGTIVEQIDSRPATSLDSLASVARGRHVATFWRRGERLEAKINVK